MFITPMAPLGQISGIRPVDQIGGFRQDAVSTAGNGMPFKEIFTTAISDLKETEVIANNDATLLALGDIDDLHTLGINATKAYLAERFVVELRNRAMEAYTELMRLNL